MNETAERRAHAAALARQYFYERSVPLDTLTQAFRDTSDPLIAELIDLATYQPPSDDRVNYVGKYWPHVAAVLEQLDRGDEGTLPPTGRWSIWKVMGLAASSLFAAASAVDHFLQARVDDGESMHGFWGTGLAITALLAAIAFASSLRQYRAQRRRRLA